MNYAMFSESKHLLKNKFNALLKDIEKKQTVDKIYYDGRNKEFNLEEMINDLNTMPFLSEHKIIILENPSFFSSKQSLDDKLEKVLEDYLKDPADFSTLIILVNAFKIDKRKKIYKKVKKLAKVYEPKQLEAYQLTNIIRDDLKALNIKVDNDAFLELEKRVSSDFDNWPNELEKLYLLNKRHLNFGDIDTLISRPSLDNVFDLSDAVIAKNLSKSIKTWRSFPKEIKEPISLIMLLASQFRLIHQVITLSDNGMRYQDLAKELSVHPYRIKLASQVSKKTDGDRILFFLKRLSILEQKIKSGKIIPEIGFELFLIEVCQ